MKKILLLAFLLYSCSALAQPSPSSETVEWAVEEQKSKDSAQIHTVVDDMPEFPGGDMAMLEFISKNIKYPSKAAEEGIQGKVYVTFIIDREGNIKDAKILRGIGGGCDEETLRVINSMPKWKPGKKDGQPVHVQYNIPLVFGL